MDVGAVDPLRSKFWDCCEELEGLEACIGGLELGSCRSSKEILIWTKEPSAIYFLALSACFSLLDSVNFYFYGCLKYRSTFLSSYL